LLKKQIKTKTLTLLNYYDIRDEKIDWNIKSNKETLDTPMNPNSKQSDIVEDNTRKLRVKTNIDPLIKHIEYIFNEFEWYYKDKLFDFCFNDYSDYISIGINKINSITYKILNNPSLTFCWLDTEMSVIKKTEEDIVRESKNPFQQYLVYLNNTHPWIFDWNSLENMKWLQYMFTLLFSEKTKNIKDFIDFKVWILKLKDNLVSKVRLDILEGNENFPNNIIR
jgi:hypothetical protein